MGVRLAAELQPAVVLIDTRMPGMDGAEAIRAILEARPSQCVAALSASSSEDEVGDALRAGARAFLAKGSPISEFAAAVRAVAGGSAWLSPQAIDAVLRRFRGTGAELGGGISSIRRVSEDQLSDRELEVLRLIAHGLENAEIGRSLDISPRTAKNHVSNILAKLDVDNRVQAAIYAIHRGLV
jgi:two-component system nitrate/nitrite response regulator NarL